MEKEKLSCKKTLPSVFSYKNASLCVPESPTILYVKRTFTCVYPLTSCADPEFCQRGSNFDGVVFVCFIKRGEDQIPL